MGMTTKIAKSVLTAAKNKTTSTSPRPACMGCGKRVASARGASFPCCGKPSCSKAIAAKF